MGTGNSDNGRIYIETFFSYFTYPPLTLGLRSDYGNRPHPLTLSAI